MATLIATPGAANANSYETVSEAQAYFDTRLPVPGWDNADSPEVLLIMGTRVLDAMSQPLKTLVPGSPAYYRVRRQWTGMPATPTQALAWPRVGMYDKNGNLIPPDVIPQALKDALSELAGQLGQGDRTLDNNVIVQGIKALKAGPVDLQFKDNILPQVIPDMVLNLMPTSWLTDEQYVLVNSAMFDVVTPTPGSDANRRTTGI